MAYAAVISLQQTIERLRNSSLISIDPPSQKIIEYAYEEVQSLKYALKRLDDSRSRGERLNALDGQIREAVHKLEDSLESRVSKQFLSQSESHPLLFCPELQELKQDIDSFTQTVKKMKEEYLTEVSNSLPEEDSIESHLSKQFLSQSEILEGENYPFLFCPEPHELKENIDSLKIMKKKYITEVSTLLEEDGYVPSIKTDFGGKKSKMVGLSDQFRKIIDKIELDLWLPDLKFIAVYGMAGIGKTTLAKEIFEDPSILSRFNCRAFVTVGPKYNLKQIAYDILAQVNPDIDIMLTEGAEKLVKYLHKSLKNKRYLIVLDDMWHKQDWNYLKRLFSKDIDGSHGTHGSRVLLTTRLYEVAIYTANVPIYEMRFLNKQESWDLLSEKVFGKESCPPQLEKAGKKIAENCEGLPLTIVMVADILSKAEKTTEYWNKVADKETSVFTDAYDKMLEVLSPSYEYLPQRLKACFLYMGVFPQNYEIPHSKLTKLWCAEGFLEQDIIKTIEDTAVENLDKLVSQSVVMVRQKSSFSYPLNLPSYQIKTCGLHSVFWYMCVREAGKNKFFHVLNSFADSLVEGIEGQRRLCIHNSVLFGIKNVHNSMASVSTVRSLLCAGPYHQYPVPICFDLRLLRVLDALTIRFYEFPIKVLKLVQLRYLALTCNGNLPTSISKLWNLQWLIVRPHLRIKSSGVESYLPIEIWYMKELKHLQIMGSDLQDPCGAVLPNLLTLLDVSAHSCTKSVLERIPNLKQLGIQIELVPDEAKPLCCFDHISHLHQLESLKCVVVNPTLRSKLVAPLPPLPNFPSRLRKLSLSGFGYPWEDMSKIALLPLLDALKLRCYAFRGPKWETYKKVFPWLKTLVIEDTDLVHWRVGRGSFPRLNCLRIKHCYKLEEIPSELTRLQTLELVDCNPLALTCAKQIGAGVRVYVHSEQDDGNLKS